MKAEKVLMANSMNTLETTAASVMVLKMNTWKKFKNDDQLGDHILPLAISLFVSCDLKG